MNNSNFVNKVTRKQKRCQHIIEKETGILTSFTPTKNIVVCNAGLANGLTQENILNAFSPFGPIGNIILLPGKSCAFICYTNVISAENAYQSINGRLNLGQDDKPLYLLFSDEVPNTAEINTYCPPGLILLKDFVTEVEEQQLLNCVDWDSSDNNLKHRKVKHYGFEFRYDINNVDKDAPLSEGIPRECHEILARFSNNYKEFNGFKADQLTVNQYEPGQGIPPHIDTHSAFEDPILSLSLGADINMEFRNNGNEFILLLPQRSLLIISGEARYAWTHGITPRKLDIIPTGNGLTVQERRTRTSFTFRKVLQVKCTCKYEKYCDSAGKKTEIGGSTAEKLEATHVHKIYEEIAGHFSDTRHKPWPNVIDFINSLPFGSILVDVGCGNGKYLGHNTNLFELGCDRSFNLLEICKTRGFNVFNCNCLSIPLKNNSADGIISIAVIHHLANENRRLRAIEEIIRVLRPLGKALIYVWAKDQKKENKSSYLKQDRKNRKESSSAEAVQNVSINVGDETSETSLPVHVNRSQFQHQDVLVPWKLKKGDNKELLRFYHVFEEGELELLCGKINCVKVVKSFYDQGNWCVIIEKKCTE